MDQNQPTAFLAWSREHGDGKSLAMAMKCVRDELSSRQYRVLDWSYIRDIRNIGVKVEEQIRLSDVIFLEASGNRLNIAYEAGLAAGLRIPRVVLKQAGTDALPEDYGAPEYLDYPNEAKDDVGFEAFKENLGALLDLLEADVMARGKREVRRSLRVLDNHATDFCSGHRADHPQLYLLSGRMDAFSEELAEGGLTRLVTDSDYYEASFDKLRLWSGGTVKAIADLTDDTEEFWKVEHPDAMSGHVSERIFLVDWQLFFERQEELSDYITQWRRHVERRHDSGYQIYIATKDQRDGEHPLGHTAIAQHLLVMEPDAVGGYRYKLPSDRRQLITERHQRHHERAVEYFQSIKNRAVRFEPHFGVEELKSRWLAVNQLGIWRPTWSRATENREGEYFAHYDKHIRCWIPSYDQMLQDTASQVELEILRLWNLEHRPLALLELGFGTGNLTERLVKWIRTFHEAFSGPGAEHPVGSYTGVDRARRMVQQAQVALRNGANPLQPRLRRGVVWDDVPDNQPYDIIFGSLILHFLLGPDPTAEILDDFFAKCAKRLDTRGGLVLADVFRPDGEAAIHTEGRWRDWIVENGTSEEFADAYMAGNADMVRSAVVGDFLEAGRRNGFECTKHKPVSDRDLPFYVFRFEKTATDAGPRSQGPGNSGG